MALECWNDYPESSEIAANWKDPPPTVIERYYTKYFYPHKGTSGVNEDQCVLLHSNKVCLVCIAPNHQLLREPIIGIKEIDFQIGKLDRSKSQVSGKRKKGGQKLTPMAPLCTVHTTDGRKFVLRSCVKGTLIEVNEKLLSDPSLLLKKPLEEGYLAVVLMKLDDAANILSGFLPEEAYILQQSSALLSSNDVTAEEQH